MQSCSEEDLTQTRVDWVDWISERKMTEMTDFYLSSVHLSSVYLWLSRHLTNQIDRETANI